ncbi:LexA family transcriptional regulator [Brevibacillus sp. MER 51]|uniref:LexA family transcriptional regulator n=1 Tax=Brevibacillus sp. MER 51 TaxID=2939560 RepID=UPI00203BF013|nr:LexA family transcriptional regulator [Brevibacillus sp. MER 51]MCM3145084.1 LexA family transcriptional regulator [Brevibacillus sp. MER 51]
MGYYETLIEMIGKSGLTLQEIADKCESIYGVKINRSYISKLQTKKQAPASDEVNVAIAKVCGGDVERFRYEGYIEKAPPFIKDFIGDLTSTLKRQVISNLETLITGEDLERVTTGLNNTPDIELVNKISAALDKVPNMDADYYNVSKHEQELKLTPLFGAKMNDDSMEPRIPIGSVLNLVNPDELKNGDIVLIRESNTSFLVRRYIKISSGVIFLSDNPSFEPIELHDSNFEIIAKVKSVTINVTN